MSPLERAQNNLRITRESGGKYIGAMSADDLAKLLAVYDAAQARFETWNRYTYEELKQALSTLTQEEGSGE